MAISTVQIVPNDNFIVLEAEGGSETIAAVFSTNTGASSATPVSLLSVLGNDGEKENGYMIFTSLSDWITRYIEAFSGRTYTDGSTITTVNPPFSGQFQTVLPACTSVTAGALCFNGITGTMARHWWGVHNYLQYGGSCVISGDYVGAGGITWGRTANNPLGDITKIPNVDVVFALEHGPTQASVVHHVVFARGKDCMGIIGTSGGLFGFGEPVNGVGGQTTNLEPAFSFGNTFAHYGISIVGNKEHFGLENDSLEILTTPLMADVAGCLARTDREQYPWYSPAGVNRGRILNVLRIPDQPSSAMRQVLQDKNVNYVLTMNGQGTFLFSDKTMNMDTTNPLENINVARLYIYLSKVLGPLANRYLFEINNAATRSAFSTEARAILQNVQSNNGITDFEIVCDETNNSQSVIDRNEFIADITITPAKSINTITIRFTNKTV